MSLDELERLLWARVDGTLSPDERRRLDEELSGHPEAERLERTVEALDRLLGILEEVEPPTELRERIDRALASATAPRRMSSVIPFRGWTGGAWRPRLLSLAAGMALGAVAAILLLPDRAMVFEDRKVSGTMVSPVTGQSLAFGLAREAGTLTVRRDGGQLALELEVVADRETVMTISSDGRRPLVRSALHESAPAGVVLREGRIELEVSVRGRHVLTLELLDGSPIRVVVSSAGELLLDRMLSQEGGKGVP